MSYVDQHNGPSPAGLASSIIVQSAIGALVIAGLSVTQMAPPIDTGPMDPIDYPLDPPPEPEEPEVQPEVSEQVPSTPPPYVPPTRIQFEVPSPKIDVTDLLPPPQPPQPKIMPKIEPALPAPTPTFDPVSAKPRNDPGAWLTNSDYRSSWVRREYTGVAGFRLDIAASGKVTGCRITSTTGHSELDEATCKLIQRRARFEPARGPNGEPVAGSFSSSVRWQLPE
ncbi:energy transducer TonB [Erythrobacter sp. SD-21]|uniref:energy transducer TonB n=1 Tax=Erythrobacter sp. SD-21 TaxID=161528 RepID=UPI000153EE6F|nr:energy transducer TonB [Erythrobacter sp. SD-21]EDL48889.1 hypothetical protein ED21_24201 [Erythrobacter sp. SD-21]